MNRPRYVLIEDEPAAMRRLERMIRAVRPDAEIVGTAEGIEDALPLFEQGPFDLVISDIELADGSSFDLFQRLDYQGAVLFVTAYDEYAIRAFKLNSIDYLLKPLREDDLAQALDRLDQRSAPTMDMDRLLEALRSTRADDKPPRRLLSRVGAHTEMVDIAEVAYVRSRHKVSHAVTLDGRDHPLDETMDELEEMLPADRFFRIGRADIVSIDAVRGMVAWSSSRLKLDVRPPADPPLVVSKERTPRFRTWLASGH